VNAHLARQTVGIDSRKLDVARAARIDVAGGADVFRGEPHTLVVVNVEALERRQQVAKELAGALECAEADDLSASGERAVERPRKAIYPVVAEVSLGKPRQSSRRTGQG